ncbi:amino acid ABC transporter ATP-binding protein [Bifidobacterium goeldii]|uniref:ABC-type polar-amino-acid transporter n=1 Tax=Bifidobacterium goeldii TaxID=2306975 RepID=A0A430FL42_9BIFI|nr:amino acid ABC transporter ATP-binding protein [Bifidobacterium goeldii]RSX53547.1 amino acid ABC transporter ATP-binding protein [Bifidobacterium goeldii]
MIKVEHVSKSFGKLEVLKDVSFQVEEGQTVALIGSSGSGKSTLLRTLNLLETPDSGDITIGDVSFNANDITKTTIAEVRQRTAMVFQRFNLFTNKTALQNVAEALIVVQHKSKAEAFDIARKRLEDVGMANWADHYPRALSGGQQQRVAIARALALNPEYLLFDEPTSALDPELVGEVLGIIQQLAQRKKTMLIVTHEMAFARDVADKVVFLDKGRIAEEGNPKSFFVHPTTQRAQQFLARFRYEFSASSGETPATSLGEVQ